MWIAFYGAKYTLQEFNKKAFLMQNTLAYSCRTRFAKSTPYPHKGSFPLEKGKKEELTLVNQWKSNLIAKTEKVVNRKQFKFKPEPPFVLFSGFSCRLPTLPIPFSLHGQGGWKNWKPANLKGHRHLSLKMMNVETNRL